MKRGLLGELYFFQVEQEKGIKMATINPMRVLDSWNRSSEANPPYLPIIGGIKQIVLKTEYILGLRISIPLDGSCWSVLVLSELIPVNTRQAQSHRKTE